MNRVDRKINLARRILQPQAGVVAKKANQTLSSRISGLQNRLCDGARHAFISDFPIQL
jgi:hypothetical protein